MNGNGVVILEEWRIGVAAGHHANPQPETVRSQRRVCSSASGAKSPVSSHIPANMAYHKILGYCL
jgi:hypothetical protein